MLSPCGDTRSITNNAISGMSHMTWICFTSKWGRRMHTGSIQVLLGCPRLRQKLCPSDPESVSSLLICYCQLCFDPCICKAKLAICLCWPSQTLTSSSFVVLATPRPLIANQFMLQSLRSSKLVTCNCLLGFVWGLEATSVAGGVEVHCRCVLYWWVRCFS